MVRTVHSILTDWAIYHETHIFATVIRSFHCSKIGSYIFLAEGCSVYWLTTYCMSMPPSVLARFKKKKKQQLFPIPFRSKMRRPTGDQEVAGSTPAEVGNILSWRLIMKYCLRSFSPFRWFKKGSCQFQAKECAQYWLTAWRTKPTQ